jgi:predicted methyltransferase
LKRSHLSKPNRSLRLVSLLLGVACGAALAQQPPAAAPAGAATPAAADVALATVLAGDWRTPAQKERDGVRRPTEVLAFWGLKPGMSILEVQPGEGWWTQILAPYAARTGGRFAATATDIYSPQTTHAGRLARQAFEARFSNPAVYGRVELVNWSMQAAPLPANAYDFILISRSVHGWMRTAGQPERYFAQLARSLKPGGSLAIEAHRGKPGPQDPKAENGYITEAHMIDMAQKAGLSLVAKSELNANPRDTKDHPFGVWTLPPTRTSVALGSGQPPNKAFDHSKYDAIGESDRMTLRFTKAG